MTCVGILWSTIVIPQQPIWPKSAKIEMHENEYQETGSLYFDYCEFHRKYTKKGSLRQPTAGSKTGGRPMAFGNSMSGFSLTERCGCLGAISRENTWPDANGECYNRPINYGTGNYCQVPEA